MTPRSPGRLLTLVESFFNDHLRRVSGASPHTVRAYGHAVRLFLIFLGKRSKRPVATLALDDIRVDAVLAFLDHLESTRRNSPSTRNCRLGAIHAFVEHLLRHDVERAAQYQRILAVRAKKARARVVAYLEPEHVRVILDQPDAHSPAGIRDRALMLFLFNTGARIAEALSLTSADLHLDQPRQVRLHGKGGKDRVCPLWPETTRVLRTLVQATPAGPIFRNARGGGLTRDGAAYILDKHAVRAAAQDPALRRLRITPHVLRHSCAVALLQAGVDLTVIRDYLGHASVATTGRYVAANLGMKRDALEAFWRRAGIVRATDRRWRPKPGVLAFLSSL
jgi:integrase/recombinase XerD